MLPGCRSWHHAGRPGVCLPAGLTRPGQVLPGGVTNVGRSTPPHRPVIWKLGRNYVIFKKIRKARLDRIETASLEPKTPVYRLQYLSSTSPATTPRQTARKARTREIKTKILQYGYGAATCRTGPWRLQRSFGTRQNDYWVALPDTLCRILFHPCLVYGALHSFRHPIPQLLSSEGWAPCQDPWWGSSGDSHRTALRPWNRRRRRRSASCEGPRASSSWSWC